MSEMVELVDGGMEWRCGAFGNGGLNLRETQPQRELEVLFLEVEEYYNRLGMDNTPCKNCRNWMIVSKRQKDSYSTPSVIWDVSGYYCPTCRTGVARASKLDRYGLIHKILYLEKDGRKLILSPTVPPTGKKWEEKKSLLLTSLGKGRERYLKGWKEK